MVALLRKGRRDWLRDAAARTKAVGHAHWLTHPTGNGDAIQKIEA
nr:hypothetical protein [Pseudomonas luteola]